MSITNERLAELRENAERAMSDGEPFRPLVSAAIAMMLLDELISLRREWRPIAEAPRDGTPVDLWHKVGTRMTEVWWTPDDCWSNCSDDSDYTHWMPIPAPPEGVG